MSGRNRITLRLAAAEDGPGIKRVFDSFAFSGGISVRYARDPDPYQSLQREGERAVIPVFLDGGEIVGVGGCVVRSVYLNGAPVKAGYLTGMKLLPEYRGKTLRIPEAYALIRENTPEVCCYYTTILSENLQARRLLEKKRRSMPEYRYQGEYTVYCFHKGKTSPRVSRGDTGGLEGFYKRLLPGLQFAPAGGKLDGLSAESFYTLRGEGGEILASCALWNQQDYKQYIVERYGGVYKAASLLPLHLLGYPRFPKEGRPANTASVALLCVKGESPLAAKELLCGAAKASGYDFLMLGLFETSPLRAAFGGIPHIKYGSRLYTVGFDGASEPLHRRMDIEVGWL